MAEVAIDSTKTGTAHAPIYNVERSRIVGCTCSSFRPETQNSDTEWAMHTAVAMLLSKEPEAMRLLKPFFAPFADDAMFDRMGRQLLAYRTNDPQPTPAAVSDRRPAWDLVVDYAKSVRGVDAYSIGPAPVLEQVIADMRIRDLEGRAKYKVPLTAGNGRDHLTDAYQEGLDFAVYIAAWLDERGYALAGVPLTPKASDWNAWCLHQMFCEHIRTVVRLRALMVEVGKSS